MPDPAIDLSRRICAKTAVGQQEILSRTLGLSPLARRLLILVDGKRSFQDLGTFVTGHDLLALLGELHTKGCIETTVAQPTAAVRAPGPAVPTAKTVDDELAKLPNANTRSAKEVDMARHFMMNTVNTVFQQNTRLTLIEAIFACKTADDTRRVYAKWSETMASSAIGVKRLPEFREKLFQVL